MGKGRFTIEAGMLVKGQIKRQLTELAWKLGLTIDIKDFGGFLSSSYGIIVEGPDDKVLVYCKAIEKWIKENE